MLSISDLIGFLSFVLERIAIYSLQKKLVKLVLFSSLIHFTF